METPVKAEILIFPDITGLARGAAAMVQEAAADRLAATDRFSVALSGGATPRMLFRLLGSEYGGKIDWNRVHLFWADERAVPPDHEQSNFGMAHAEWISKIAIPTRNIHRIRGEMAPADAAATYEADLASYFGSTGTPVFDLLLLGLGEDGHTASLFPGSDALSEERRLAVPVLSPLPPDWRISLTLPVLNHARLVAFLVSGTSKAGIIGEILAGGKGGRYPAGAVKPVGGRVIWFLDKEAAARLSHSL